MLCGPMSERWIDRGFENGIVPVAAFAHRYWILDAAVRSMKPSADHRVLSVVDFSSAVRLVPRPLDIVPAHSAGLPHSTSKRCVSIRTSRKSRMEKASSDDPP